MATTARASGGGDPYIKLGQFLKLTGVVPTGGRAKQLIQAGQVRVNGEVEARRGGGGRPSLAGALGGCQSLRLAPRSHSANSATAGLSWEQMSFPS